MVKAASRKLTHLTDMQPIDRPFDPDRRTAELAEVAEAASFPSQMALARPVIERAVMATGRAPGLFIDEDDNPEVRWILPPDGGSSAKVVNVSFGSTIDVYVFDRLADEIIHESSIPLTTVAPGDLIADVITAAMDGDGD